MTHTIHVVLAILSFEDKYLIAKRHKNTHMGDKLEFVGGKAEKGEMAEDAMIRELAEELGINCEKQQLYKLGGFFHEYEELGIEFEAFGLDLTPAQYNMLKECEVGVQGQALFWLTKDEILARINEFPAANRQMLDWL